MAYDIAVDEGGSFVVSKDDAHREEEVPVDQGSWVAAMLSLLVAMFIVGALIGWVAHAWVNSGSAYETQEKLPDIHWGLPLRDLPPPPPLPHEREYDPLDYLKPYKI